MATYYIAGMVTGILATVGGICCMAATVYFVGNQNGHGFILNHLQPPDADVWQVYTPAADDDDDDDDAAGPQAE